MNCSKEKFNAISFFTGAGGLDLGFEAAGFDVKLSIDIMLESCRSLRHNFPNKLVFGPPDFSGNINELTPDLILKMSKLKRGEIDLMIGGPPCQPFSMAAAQRFLKSDENFKRKGFECDQKGQLIFSYTELIVALKPKVFLIENVPGILSIDGGSGIKVVYDTLTKAGYTVCTPFILDAKDFGVPQNRRRAFVIGTLSGNKITAPHPTHSSEPSLLFQAHTTVSQALFGLNDQILNTEIRDHKASSVNRYKGLKFGEREKLGRVDRLDPRKPSKTVIAGGSGGGGRSHLHPYLARTMSVRECARLQTFPDKFVFLGKNGRQFTQVGNAVPPLLAEVLARRILECEYKIKFKAPYTFRSPDVSIETADKALLKKSVKEHPELLYSDVKSMGLCSNHKCKKKLGFNFI